MDHLPAPELRDILLPSYRPCEEFSGTCKGVAKWKPKNGDVPRGFIGATAGLDRVEVVILVAEPGHALDNEKFPQRTSPGNFLEQTCDFTYGCYKERHREFHANMRLLLDLIFPETSFAQQMKKVWITETLLCSISNPIGHVPVRAERGCAERYLLPQLRLLNDRPIIALGGKAQRRALRITKDVPDMMFRLIKAYSIAPPGCNHKPARPSWEAAAKQARLIMSEREGKQLTL